MSNRIYDSSQLTKRKTQKAIAGSFLSRMYPPNSIIQPQQGFGLVPGIYDSSVMNSVKTGNMTEYTRYPTCVGISPGCPCPQVNASLIANPQNPSIPGAVSGITFTIGSMIVSWDAPEGNGPFTYRVTPYKNGVERPFVTTTDTSYRFTVSPESEWQPFTFTVCAMNSAGSGPVVPSTSYFIAPPESLSIVMSGSSTAVVPEPSLKYIINNGLDSILQYIASVNLGPTRGSRYMYVWITSIVGAWNWVRPEIRIDGEHDEWNWSLNKATKPLNDNDSLIWLCSVIDYVTPFFIPSGYKSIYNCPVTTVERVKLAGEWNRWLNNWQAWYNYRQNDGFIVASTEQPTSSANWNETIIVDSTTVNNIAEFPKPQEWTRLTVEGKKQGYLTYSWDNVLSSCLTSDNEQTIEASVEPATGAARDAEIDEVKEYAVNLTDEQKIIAEFWAGGPGTVSPPLMFIWMWKEYMRILPSISCPDIIFSLQDLAVHLFEMGRVTWRLKTAYMESRPIQEIRRRFAGQQIQSWNGMIDGSQWIPYQEANFVSPPFADFPSGHSSFSKAFALTMNKWFGASITKATTFYDQQKLICPLFETNETITYGDFLVEQGASLIESSVPASAITLSFNTWNEIADQAGLSRLYGGIHAITAHTSSQQTAVEVDTLINSTWNILTDEQIIEQNIEQPLEQPEERGQ